MKTCSTLNSAPHCENIWGGGGTAPRISALDGDGWSVLRPGRFTYGEKAPRFTPDRRLNGSLLSPCRESNPPSSSS